MVTIKLMPDYGCFPVWGVDEVGNIDPESLPITNDLRLSLARWSEWYDRTLDQSSPADSGFRNKQEETAFEAEGIRIWKELQKQLAKSHKVVYFSTAENRIWE